MDSAASIQTFEHDGTYSWLVLVTIILCNFSSYGLIAGNLGVLSGYYPEVFDENLETTNVISSVALGTFMFSVPILTLVMKIVGCRVIATTGALLTLIGMISAAFVTQIWQLIIAYSILIGVGASLTFTSSVGIIPHYFKERKAAAYTGIGLGVGIGFTAYPYITSAAFDTFGYKVGMFSLLPILIPTLATPFVFKPQLPKAQRVSLLETLSTYAKAFRHFVTPFILANSFFIVGARSAMNINFFGYMTVHFDTSVAVVAYTIHGVSFLIFTIIFTLYGLKFYLNYYIAVIVINFIYGIAVFLVPFLSSPVLIYICSGVLGAGFGTSFGFKGNLAAHVVPAKDVTFVYGLTEAVGGVAVYILPLSVGYIQASFGNESGFYLMSACCVLAGLLLCLAALIRPTLWQPYMCANNKLDGSKSSIPIVSESPNPVGGESPKQVAESI